MTTRTRLMAMGLSVVMSLSATAAAATDESAFDPNPRPHSIAIDWVDAMLEGIERNPPAPTATTWRMLVVLSSMYDAWAAYDDRALATVSADALRRPTEERTASNQRAAVSYAAHNALNHVFPDQAAIFDAVLQHAELEPDASFDPSTPAGIGNIAAAGVIRARSMRGASAYDFRDAPSSLYAKPYRPSTGGDPNRWAPLHVPTGSLLDAHGRPVASMDDPASYETQVFLTPHWGAVEPFAMTRGDQLRPPGPPRLGSDEPYEDALGASSTGDAAFRAQTAEVLGFSGSLTDEHKVIAEFWADGPHTWTPPGHWVQLAIGVSLRDGHDLAEDVCMYLALAGALYDAGIAAWDAKRAFDYLRPVKAIPLLYGGQEVVAWRGPDLGIGVIDGATWQPYQASTFVTPPFAEYVSGHSTFSAAAAEVLAMYTGSDRMFDGSTVLGRDYDGDGTEDLLGQHIATPGTLLFERGPAEIVTLHWPTFSDAAAEAGISRLYGGIHFQDGDLRGRDLGREVGQIAFEHARSHWDPAT